MNRPPSKLTHLLRRRNLRWVAMVPLLLELWACGSHRLAIPDPHPSVGDTRQFKQTINNKLDIIFMVDDSPSMSPLETKMRAQLPAFMDALADKQTHQLPDLHVGVVSQSMGAGAWGNVSQCETPMFKPDTLGDDGGRFVQGAVGTDPSPCTMLHPQTKFLANMDGPDKQPNYDGDIRNAFQCIAYLGDKGCGFEAQFASVYSALAKANKDLGPSDDSHDPDNGGFLRPDAILAIVMVTNEDDCSVREDSLLLDPGVNSATNASGLGALASYRCNEFGHLCDGQPPPHGYNFATMQFDNTLPLVPGGVGGKGLLLNNCKSEEGHGKTDDTIIDPNGHSDPTRGHLWPTVVDFTAYVKQFKANPGDILVAAIAGPVADANGDSLYRVHGEMSQSGGAEVDPFVDHSCVQPTSDATMPEYADPAVRINEWVHNMNGVFYPICANDFSAAMMGIAAAINKKIGASCVSTQIAADPMDPTKHNCTVSQTITDGGKQTTRNIPNECDAGITNAPCYQLTFNSGQCIDAAAKTLFKVCDDSTCMTMPGSTATKDDNVSCVVQ